jgi:hypothetical protein
MKTTVLFLGAMMLWIVLNRWVLPWFGVPTCMSGGCSGGSCPPCGPPPSDYGNQDINTTRPGGDRP